MKPPSRDVSLPRVSILKKSITQLFIPSHKQRRILYHIPARLSTPRIKNLHSAAHSPSPPSTKNCRAPPRQISHHYKKFLSPLQKICRATAKKSSRPCLKTAAPRCAKNLSPVLNFLSKQAFLKQAILIFIS